MTTVVLQGSQLTQSTAQAIANQLEGELQHKAQFSIIETSSVSKSQIEVLREQYAFDINALPDNFSPSAAKLLVTDMDSTLISIECIDEIADYIQVKLQVAEITEAAMRGEIDFETSLKRRVSLLKGLDESSLQRVYDERLTLNPGAEVTVSTLQSQGIKTALVSGGFTFFTERLKQRLALDFTMANVLAIEEGKLTGDVVGAICGAQAKADFLLAKCTELNIEPSQVIAMGDGANDLVMMAEAGLSVAYHAKPKVQQQADVVINHNGLDALLGLLQLDYN
jgi:phosphoserine phosphatase